MRLHSNEVVEVPDVETIYLKKWQSNGYFPIEIAERTPNGWKVYYTNNRGKKYGFSSYTDKTFLYKLKSNPYLISDTPMCNENVYNFE